MILELLLSPVFLLIGLLIDQLPVMASHNIDITPLFSLLGQAFIIFPPDLFLICIGNVSFWLSIQMLWAIIEWIYKKIPGVS